MASSWSGEAASLEDIDFRLRGNAAGDEGGDCYFLQCSEGKFAFVDSCFFWECFEAGPKAIRELGKRKVGELVSMVVKEVESFAEWLGCVAKEFRLLPKIRRRVRDVPKSTLTGVFCHLEWDGAPEGGQRAGCC